MNVERIVRLGYLGAMVVGTGLIATGSPSLLALGAGIDVGAIFGYLLLRPIRRVVPAAPPAEPDYPIEYGGGPMDVSRSFAGFPALAGRPATPVPPEHPFVWELPKGSRASSGAVPHPDETPEDP